MVVVLLVVFIVFKDQLLYVLKFFISVEVFYVFVKKRFFCYVDSDFFLVFERVFYNLISFDDEIIWVSLWLYFVIGNVIYLDDVIIFVIDNSN